MCVLVASQSPIPPYLNWHPQMCFSSSCRVPEPLVVFLGYQSGVSFSRLPVIACTERGGKPFWGVSVSFMCPTAWRVSSY